LKSLLLDYAPLSLAVILSLLFYVIFFELRIVQTDEAALGSLMLLVSMIVFFLGLDFLLALIPFRWIRFTLNLWCLFLLFVLLGYQLTRGAPLDYALVHSNFSEMFSRDGMNQIFKVGGIVLFSLLPLSIMALTFIEYKYRTFSKTHFELPKHLVWGLLLVALNFVFLFSFYKNPNPLYAFSRSSISYLHDPAESLMRHIDSPEQFPILRNFTASNRLSKKPDHVFLILMESFSAAFVEKKTAEDRQITPFFNSLIKEGLYFSNFYSNSMQTERGQTATICSVIPSYRRKIMTAYVEDQFRCLPKILADAGYLTHFFQAQPDLKYDNTGEFMRRAGFQSVLSMDKNFVKESEREFVWGWGLQDDLFFKKTFSWLDQLSDSKKKTFNVLATISNHQNFDEMPDNQKYLYPKPKSFSENYENSMYLADEYLKTFFEELRARKNLRNSMVILLGDHGFPSGVHGNLSNEIGFHNELFHIPLVIWWPEALRPARIEKQGFSQIDVAPTIADFLKIKGKTHFAGQALPLTQDEASAKARAFPILQPYDGVHLGAMNYPWKYMKSLSSGAEFLFNLEIDPMESENLILSDGLAVDLAALKAEVKNIYLNQRLLEENRIFPVAH